MNPYKIIKHTYKIMKYTYKSTAESQNILG